MFPFKEIIDTGTIFSTLVEVYNFSVSLGLTGSLLVFFLMIGVSGVFYILFLLIIQRVSGVSLDKLSPSPYKIETLKFPL